MVLNAEVGTKMEKTMFACPLKKEGIVARWKLLHSLRDTMNQKALLESTNVS